MPTPVMNVVNIASVKSASLARSLRLVTVFATLLLLGSLQPAVAESAREAADLFQRGRYDDALEIYRQLSLESPDDHRLSYNAGVAAFKAGQMAEAMSHFDVASLAQDLALQQRAHYNMGNALYRAGEEAADFEEKSEQWKQAIQRYEHAVTINADDSLAEENLEFVKRRLEQLQQQQQEQQQNQQDQNQEDDQEQDENENQDQNQENQQNQDSEQQQNSDSEEQEQEEQNQEQQQDQEGQQEEEQNQSQQNQGDQEQEQQQNSPQEQEGQDQNESQSPQQAQPQQGKMTPEQAKQLLDAERDQAKAMIFQPPQRRRARNKSLKDW